MSDENKGGEGGAGPVQRPAPSVKMRQIEFIIEMGDKKNRTFLNPITQQKMRGRWTRDNHREMDIDHDGQYAPLRQLPDLPGISIHVNTGAKRVRVFDPLGEPGNADLLEQVKKIVKLAMKKDGREEKTTVYEDCNEDELKSWLYWARRFVDARQCEVVSGRVPEMKEIMSLPGKIIKSINQESMTDEERYRPVSA